MGRRAEQHSEYAVHGMWQCGGCAHIKGVVEDLATDVAIRSSSSQIVRTLHTASEMSLMI